jgi:hypothetical protein
MEKNIVQYRYFTDRGNTWKTLRHLNETFNNMPDAIKYIRNNYNIFGIIKIQLRLINDLGSISEWDNL